MDTLFNIRIGSVQVTNLIFINLTNLESIKL